MSDKKLKKDFTEGPIFVRMIIFAIPIILTGLLQLCYNMADNIVVGKFSGDEFALAAVGATGSLHTLIINLLMGIGAGAGIIVAHSYGAKDENTLSRAVHTSLTFSLFAGIAFAIIFFFVSKPALELVIGDQNKDQYRPSRHNIQIRRGRKKPQKRQQA